MNCTQKNRVSKGLIILITFFTQSACADCKDCPKIYYEFQKERALFEKHTSVFLSSEELYKSCLTKTASLESCNNEISRSRETIDRINKSSDHPTATVVPTPQDLNIFIQNNIINKTPRERPTFIYTIISTPSNSYKPDPSFTPQNRFQNGDGFNPR